MSGPIVVGSPTGAGMAAVREIAGLFADGTLAWSDAEALRVASDAVVSLGWDTLVVRGDDEGFSTAAMSHRSQIHGAPPVLVIAAGDGDDNDEVVAVATMVARHLDVLPVVVLGDLAADWTPVQKALELPDAVFARHEDVSVVLDELIDVASMNRRNHA